MDQDPAVDADEVEIRVLIRRKADGTFTADLTNPAMGERSWYTQGFGASQAQAFIVAGVGLSLLARRRVPEAAPEAPPVPQASLEGLCEPPAGPQPALPLWMQLELRTLGAAEPSDQQG